MLTVPRLSRSQHATELGIRSFCPLSACLCSRLQRSGLQLCLIERQLQCFALLAVSLPVAQHLLQFCADMQRLRIRV